MANDEFILMAGKDYFGGYASTGRVVWVGKMAAIRYRTYDEARNTTLSKGVNARLAKAVVVSVPSNLPDSGRLVRMNKNDRQTFLGVSDLPSGVPLWATLDEMPDPAGGPTPVGGCDAVVVVGCNDDNQFTVQVIDGDNVWQELFPCERDAVAFGSFAASRQVSMLAVLSLLHKIN